MSSVCDTKVFFFAPFYSLVISLKFKYPFDFIGKRYETFRNKEYSLVYTYSITMFALH